MRFVQKLTLSVALLSATLLSAQNTPLPLPSGRPNVVMIISDDQAWTDYGFMGHPHIQTPHLDRLAAGGVLFRKGYVPTALCRPSLMTMITGRYAHEHGITGNDPSPKYARPGSDLYNQQRARLISYVHRYETLPKLLSKKGYVSFQSGKWWEGNYQEGGFTQGMTRGFPQPGGRHGDDGLDIGREGMKPVFAFIDKAVERKNPFFLWYAPFLPHSPHNPPERILSKYQDLDLPESVAKYQAMCEWFDETCGELIEHLNETGLRENTLIVYVCDNGWIQDPGSSRYAPRSKQTAYEGGIRTPIIFNWPGTLAPDDRSERVSSIDLFPTIAAAVQAKPPSSLPGVNLLPPMIHQTGIPRTAIYGEGFAHDIADIRKPEASLLYRWVIEGPWKLLLTYDGEVNRYQSTHPRSEKRPQLFNLDEDPHETRNVASEHPDRVKRMARMIEDWYPVRERTALTTTD